MHASSGPDARPIAPRRDRTPRLPVDGAHLPQLLDDLDAALADLLAPVEAHPAIWNDGRPGKWSAGQVIEHVGIALHVFVDRFERIEHWSRQGRMERMPWRDPVQWLFIRLVVRGGRMPSGARSAKVLEPAELPNRTAVLARFAEDRARTLALGLRLSSDDLDRLWIHNPIIPSWHYTFPEAVRIQAIHARHHTRQIAAIPMAASIP